MWTEEQARSKWCQESRVVQTDGVASSSPRNRVANVTTMQTEADHLFGAACIGSRCMAWRWATAIDQNGDRVPSMHAGYCGKAGRA